MNAFVEIFLERLRDKSLKETLFTSVLHARAVLEAWRNDYTVRARIRRSRNGHHRGSEISALPLRPAPKTV